MNTWRYTSVAILVIGSVTGCRHADRRCARADALAPLALDCVTVSPAPVATEPELQGPHPVDFYVRIALARNPEIAAARDLALAQAEVVPQVRALDDPILSNAVYPIKSNSPQTASGRLPYSMALLQNLPWFHKLRIRGEVASQDAVIALNDLAATELKVIEEVQYAYYELFFNARAIAITKENERLLNDLIQFAEARYATGQTSQQDVLFAQVRLSDLHDQLIALNEQLGLAQADMAKLLETSPNAEPLAESTIELPSAPEQIDALYELAVEIRPELQARLNAIIRDQRNVDLARLQYFPDFTVGLLYANIEESGSISPVRNGNDWVGLSVGLNLPVWRRKLQAGVQEALFRTSQSARQYDAARDETFRLIRRQMIKVRAIERQIALFRDDIIPKAEQTLRVSAADYRVGKVVFVQLIDNWNDLLNFQIQLARLQASLGQAFASLERVVGQQIAAPDQEHAVPPSEAAPEPALQSDQTG